MNARSVFPQSTRFIQLHPHRTGMPYAIVASTAGSIRTHRVTFATGMQLRCTPSPGRSGAAIVVSATTGVRHFGTTVAPGDLLAGPGGSVDLYLPGPATLLWLDGDAARGAAEPAVCERYATVLRAEDAMWKAVDELLPLAAIAREVHCSERTLLAHFRAYYGVGPMRYFRIQRLNAVRDALRIETGRTISDVALAFGFNHLGRFCTAYRELFGVTPSASRRLADAA